MADLNLTPKQENFCQLYIELGNASEAYRQSYDADSMNENTVHRNASALLDNNKVATRIEQIRKEHKKRHNITVDTLLLELEEARQAALTGERIQSAAAVAATMGKAKLLGLDKQIIDVTTNGESLNSKPTVIELVAHNVESSD
ncbi:terminase small subunit [Acinetobacter phage vB_AbaM_fThrA]|nr:putative terminase small subunit [Acinetobacter phage BUCT628]WVH13521.1 terminase small subunit [Acinetobacter phage vB_AbaM_fThrA]